MLSMLMSNPWCACFDGAEGGQGGQDGGQAGGQGGQAGGQAGEKKTFTQEEVNKFLAEDRRKHQAQLKEQEERLQDVLKSNALTEQDRKTLKENLDSVQGQLRSAEAAAIQEKQALEKQYHGKVTEAQELAKKWEGLYRTSTIDRALMDAAARNDAYNPEQLVTLLSPMTKLVEVLDSTTQQPTGQFEPQVVMMDVNPKTGQQEPMTRTPDAAVKRMKELPEKYGNLFKANVVSGLGSGSATGGSASGGGRINVKDLTPAQYRELRKTQPERLGLRPR